MIQQRMFGCQTRVFENLSLFEKDPYLIENGDELIDGWRRAYPGIGVETEILKAHVWQISNPANRKKNQSKFLNNWMKLAAIRARETWNKPAPTVAEAIRLAGV
jgi:hypothetical protein